jgi:hypothetical protein
MTSDAQTCIALAIVAWAAWFIGRRMWRFARALQSAGGLRRWCSSCAGCAAGRMPGGAHQRAGTGLPILQSETHD